jgi:hypothetical protein
MTGTSLRVTRLKRTVVVAGVAGLTMSAGLMMSGVTPAAGAGLHSANKPAVGDHCLVGTWRDNGGQTSTKWNGHHVVMHSGGRDYDHISAAGTDRNSFATSKPSVGRIGGHRLTERVRGTNRLRLHATGRGRVHQLAVTELGWSKRAINRYRYRGKGSTGYLNQTGSYTYRFRCTLTTLTFLGRKGHPRGSETRISFRP